MRGKHFGAGIFVLGLAVLMWTAVPDMPGVAAMVEAATVEVAMAGAAMPRT